MIKRRWSLDYLQRKYQPKALHEWTVETRQRLQRETGVPYTYSDVHGAKRTFQAYLDMKQIAIVDDPDKTELFVRTCKTYAAGIFGCVSFSEIAEESGLPLLDVMGIAKHLITSGKGAGYPNRSGHIVYIKAR